MDDALFPLITQVAGHAEDTGFGFLQSNEGYVLKPLQLRQRGTNEVQFYEDVNSANSDDSVISELKSMMPKYYGQHCFTPADPEATNYIKLEDLTHDFAQPCVMDVKMGFVTWKKEASADKIARAKCKFPPQEEVGFQLRGMRIYNNQKKMFEIYDKQYFRSFLSREDVVKKGLALFLSSSGSYAKELALSFLRKLSKVEIWFAKQRRYSFISSSLLLVYDAGVFQLDEKAYCSSSLKINGVKHHATCNTLDAVMNAKNEAHESALNDLDKACKVCMIDFAHVHKSDCIDANYFGGVQQLISLFHDTISEPKSDLIL